MGMLQIQVRSNQGWPVFNSGNKLFVYYCTSELQSTRSIFKDEVICKSISVACNGLFHLFQVIRTRISN